MKKRLIQSDGVGLPRFTFAGHIGTSARRPARMSQAKPIGEAIQCQSALAEPAHLDQKLVAKLNEYKAGLLAQFSSESEVFLHFARLAINEAESLAWSTPYPHLLFPTLAEEKIHYVWQWASRQWRVGSGLTVVATATANPQAAIRQNEPVRTNSPNTLANGLVSRSSEAPSRAFEAAQSNPRP